MQGIAEVAHVGSGAGRRQVREASIERDVHDWTLMAYHMRCTRRVPERVADSIVTSERRGRNERPGNAYAIIWEVLIVAKTRRNT